jgi:hypothetical protein
LDQSKHRGCRFHSLPHLRWIFARVVGGHIPPRPAYHLRRAPPPNSGAAPNCGPDVLHAPCPGGNGCRSYPHRSRTSRTGRHPSWCGTFRQSASRGLRLAKTRDRSAQYRNDAVVDLALGRNWSPRFPLPVSGLQDEAEPSAQIKRCPGKHEEQPHQDEALESGSEISTNERA